MTITIVEDGTTTQTIEVGYGGPAGPPGATGPAGPAGATGPAGADGLVPPLSAGTRLVGRGAGAGGPAEEITLSNSLIMTGTELTVRSGVFNYSYNTSTAEPPSAGQVRLNAGSPWTAATKLWLRYVSADGQDLYWGITLIGAGATLLVQDKDDHTLYVRLTTTGDPIDKGLYAELPVAWQANGGSINTGQQVFLRVAGTISPSLQLDALTRRVEALEKGNPMISTLRTQDGMHYLTAELNGDVNATRTEESLGAWQDWDVLADPFGDATVRVLKSAHDLYLSAYSPEYCVEKGLPLHAVGATAPYADEWERFRVVRDGNVIRLQSCKWGLWLSPQNVKPSPLAGGGEVLCNGPDPEAWETLTPSNMAAFSQGQPGAGPGGPSPLPPSSVGGAMRPLQGEVRVHGRSFADATGPRLVHGCSDFGALIKYHEDRDTYLRQLDEVAKHQQYTRLAWRLNGWKWTTSGLTVDPIRDAWFEDALRGVLQAHLDRGLKVNLSSFDMNAWSDAQAMEWFTRVAQIAASYPRDLVWLSAVTNEMQGTWEPGECDENIAKAEDLMERWVSIFPNGVQALSDPKDRNKEGMKRLAWTCALIHDQRWSADDAIRHAFNSVYENYPGVPIVQDEPTGPNGSPPHNDFTRLVYQPIEDHDELLAIYTMHILSGQASTYFNDPALVSREPLHSTWGFQELPRLWREMGLPENIGQGEPKAGHVGGAMMQVVNSHAARADGMITNGVGVGVISGAWDGQPWAVRAGQDGHWSVWYATGQHWEGRLQHGQVIPTRDGFKPAVVLLHMDSAPKA